MGEKKPASISSRSKMSDAFVKLIDGMLNPDESEFLSEIEDIEQVNNLTSMKVQAEYFGDQITLGFITERRKNMLNLDRQNAKLAVKIAQGVQNNEIVDTDADKNKGVKQELDRLFEGLMK